MCKGEWWKEERGMMTKKIVIYTFKNKWRFCL